MTQWYPISTVDSITYSLTSSLHLHMHLTIAYTCIQCTPYSSGFVTGEVGASEPSPTNVFYSRLAQTVEEVVSWHMYRRGCTIIAMHTYCDCLFLRSNEKLFGPLTFFGLATPLPALLGFSVDTFLTYTPSVHTHTPPAPTISLGSH